MWYGGVVNLIWSVHAFSCTIVKHSVIPFKEIHSLKIEIEKEEVSDARAVRMLEIIDLLIKDNRDLSTKLGALTWPAVLPPTRTYLE